MAAVANEVRSSLYLRYVLLNCFSPFLLSNPSKPKLESNSGTIMHLCLCKQFLSPCLTYAKDDHLADTLLTVMDS